MINTLRNRFFGNLKWLGIVALVIRLAMDGVLVEAQQQPKKVPRVGYLSGASIENDKPLVAALRQGLRELGYSDGKDIIIEERYVSGRSDKLGVRITACYQLNVSLLSRRSCKRASKDFFFKILSN